MNEDQQMRRLFSAARAETPPPVDVVDDVLTRLPLQPKARRGNVLLWAYASVTAAAATFVAAWALRALLIRQDLALDLVGPVIGVLP